MAKQRGRKTTNSFFVEEVVTNTNASIKSSVAYLSQKIIVKPDADPANIPSGDFTVKLVDADTAQTIAHNAKRAVVETTLEALESVEAATCTGGRLGNDPVKVEFTALSPNVPTGTLLTYDDTGLTNATVNIEKQAGEPATWVWSKDTFKDANSGRIVMEVNAMSLTVNKRGKWELQYVPRVYTRRHKWVYKLQAFDADNKQLFRLIMRPIGRAPESFLDESQATVTPDQRVYHQTGRTNTAAISFDHIAYWTRCGAGEFRD